MARHTTRPRPDNTQSAPVLELDVRRTDKHRKLDAGRQQRTAAPDFRLSQYHALKAIGRASPMKPSQRYAARATVSVAGVFKSEHKGSRQDKKNRLQKEKTPEIIADLEDGIDEARWVINNKTHETFEQVHARFNQRILTLGKDDKEFLESVSHKASLLSAPLADEKLETRVRRNGEQTIQVVEIGNRVTAFKTLVDKEEESLVDLWRQWDELQEEYIKLGVEVFGPQKFGDGAVPYSDLLGGYKKDMEHWVLEYDASIEEIDDEIEGIGIKILHKMKTMEKQLDIAAKKEQARLLQSIME